MNARQAFQDVPQIITLETRAALATWLHFTRVPLPARWLGFVDEAHMRPNRAARYMPLVSAVIGLFSGAVFWITFFLTEHKGLAVTGTIASTIWITGAFRERGAAHFFDTFSQGQTNYRARAIGAGGVIAIILLILAKFQLLMALPNSLILTAVIASQAFSSFATMAFLFTHHPLHPEMHGRYTNLSEVRLSETDFIMLALLGMLPIALLGHPAFIVLLPLLWVFRALLGVYLTRRPERYTSDALAITQQTTELSFYLGVIVIIRFLP
jgi:adenosylcobinamide-GDP ribazoletransferase